LLSNVSLAHCKVININTVEFFDAGATACLSCPEGFSSGEMVWLTLILGISLKKSR